MILWLQFPPSYLNPVCLCGGADRWWLGRQGEHRDFFQGRSRPYWVLFLSNSWNMGYDTYSKRWRDLRAWDIIENQMHTYHGFDIVIELGHQKQLNMVPAYFSLLLSFLLLTILHSWNLNLTSIRSSGWWNNKILKMYGDWKIKVFCLVGKRSWKRETNTVPLALASPFCSELWPQGCCLAQPPSHRIRISQTIHKVYHLPIEKLMSAWNTMG